MPISPSSISGLELWFKADAYVGNNNDILATWEDQSTNNRDGTAVATPTYLTNRINGLPAIDFNGTDRFSLPNFLTGFSAGTVFFVAVCELSGISIRSGHPIGDWGTHGGGNADHYPWTGDNNIYSDFGATLRKNFDPAGALNSWHIATTIAAANDWRFYYNGSSEFTTGTNTVGWNTTPMIGGDVDLNYSFDGELAEVIFYSSALSTDDQQRVEWYLASKYGISGPVDTDIGHGLLIGGMRNRLVIS
jgi:hypothetical protein